MSNQYRDELPASKALIAADSYSLARGRNPAGLQQIAIASYPQAAVTGRGLNNLLEVSGLGRSPSWLAVRLLCCAAARDHPRRFRPIRSACARQDVAVGREESGRHRRRLVRSPS